MKQRDLYIKRHLMGYLNKYKLLHESQSGFRQKHSCQTALIKLIDKWMACIDKGDIVGALYLDFRKAFDLVDHSIMIRKLSLYKFNQSAISWFTQYLNHRQQAIVSDMGISLRMLFLGSLRGLYWDRHYFCYTSITYM